MKIDKSPLNKLELPLFLDKKVEVWVKRDDLIHDEMSGNKWRKLRHTVSYLKSQNKYRGVLTFGGAYSNHILAVAYVALKLGLGSVAIIRGGKISPLNKTLARCTELGMKIIYWDRERYKTKHEQEVLVNIQNEYPDYYIVPEGGADKLGIKGCEDIVTEIEIDFDYITIDCGTGATLAGMVRSLKRFQKAIGFQVLKGEDFISEEVERWNTEHKSELNYEVNTEYHFGGYAKKNLKLIEFMRSFYTEAGIKTDPIYTAKQFYGVLDLIKKDYFPKNSKIVIVHSGGMQGLDGFEKRYKIKVY